MATLTKKELLEDEDFIKAPMNAKLKFIVWDGEEYQNENIENPVFVEHLNEILLC